MEVIIGEIDQTGLLSKAVALHLIEAKDLTINDILYSSLLGSVVQGRDIFSNNAVIINSPNIIMLYNSGDSITFPELSHSGSCPESARVYGNGYALAKGEVVEHPCEESRPPDDSFRYYGSSRLYINNCN